MDEIIDLHSALRQFVLRHRAQLKGALPFVVKPQVWFVTELDELPENHKTLLQQAVTHGLKFSWESDVRVISTLGLKDALYQHEGPHPWIVLLGHAFDKSMIGCGEKERYSRFIQTESVADVLSSTEIKKKFWNDIKVIKDR